MGIGNMLNNKAGQQAAQGAVHEQQGQQIPPLHLDRANSPHGSEHSRYSGPMNTSYPSPTAMAAALPPMPNPGMAPAPMSIPNLPPSVVPHGMAPGSYKPQEAAQPPVKAYPCSTCGKGFARRSDLARHGECFIILRGNRAAYVLTDRRTHPQRHPASRLRFPQLRKTVHPALRSHSPPACAHGREASPV